MISPLNTFNRLAPFYDRSASFVYGKSIREAQTYFMNEIKPGSKIIILGGGTGWILNALFRIQPDCKVWYIEASSSMIKSAIKKTSALQGRIIFIHGTEDSIPEDISADYVIVNFFLDLFTPDQLKNVLDKIRSSLAIGGMLLVTDFVDQGKVWQKVLLKIMYFFFRVMCGIRSVQLPPWEQQLADSGLREWRSRLFFHDFIKSTCLGKKANQ